VTVFNQVSRILLVVGGKRFEGNTHSHARAHTHTKKCSSCIQQSFLFTDFRYSFSAKPEGGYSMPEFDADWEKGIFPMGQVPVLQANGHRFPQACFTSRPGVSS
jgi:hypothetical protein